MPATSAALRRPTPLWRLFAVTGWAFALLPTTGPVFDIDLYWHVRVGDWMLDHHAIPRHELFDFPALGRPWVPHAWLSEVLLALAHRAGGWGGVVALRMVTAAVLLALLARAVVRGADAVVGPVVFAVAAAGLSPQLQDRPQLFAYVLMAAFLPAFYRALEGTAPRWWAAFGLGWLWASLHGTWPLLPGLLLLAAVGMVADRRPLRETRGHAVAALAAVAGSALTPVGPALLLRPFLVASNVNPIQEWQQTKPAARYALVFTLLVATLLVAWARGRRPVPLSELLWAGAIVASALQIARNVPVAVILLAPLIARRVSDLVPAGRRSTVPRWALTAYGTLCALVVVAVAVPSPRLPTDAPLTIVAALRAQPEEVRVLNDYNVGGFLTGHGISVALDGRVEAFPEGFVDRYDRLANLLGDDWEDFLAELRPTHAVLRKGMPLTWALRQKGWRLVTEDEVFVLLAAPTAP